MPAPAHRLRFVCDQHIDAAVPARLRSLGHDAWTAAQGAVSSVSDDELAIYSDDKRAIVVTHDREFSQRRRNDLIGHHVWLRCEAWDGADLIARFLPDVEPVLARPKPAMVSMSQAGYRVHFGPPTGD